MGNDVLPATQIAGLVSRAVFLIACEEEMYNPLTSLMEGAEPIHMHFLFDALLVYILSYHLFVSSI